VIDGGEPGDPGHALGELGNVKSFMKNGRTYETTEVTEKHSVSSKKQIKRQRHREVENRLVGRG
jgi:hypothetical protein